MSLANLPSPNFSGADLSARVNAALLEARAARRVASVPALLADASLGYSGARPVVAGDRIETADGHAYEVAAVTAADHHLATMGGVRLRVLPGPFGADLRAFGCRLDGTQDDTARLAAALAGFETVLCPAGTYRLTSVTIPAGRRIVTAGPRTVFQQAPGLPEATPMLRIAGSNVTLGLEGFTVRGNIATDAGEHMHAVHAQPTDATGPIANVRIGDIWAQDIRGDAVWLGQRAGSASRLSNVDLGWVDCANVYRNGVSVVSGRGVRVKGVTGTGVGYAHFLVEPNLGTGVVENVWCGYVRGRLCGVVPPSAAEAADGIHIGTLDLSPAHSGQSVPAYAPGQAVADGLMLRNLRRLRIDHFRAEGFDRCAAFVTSNAGELGAEMVDVGTMHLRNCSLTDSTYHAFVFGAGNSRWDIGFLDVAVGAIANKRVFSTLHNSRIGGGKIDLGAGVALLRDCNDDVVGPLAVTGGGTPFANCNRITVLGGSFAGNVLAAFSARCTFVGVTATASTALFTSGYEDHAILASNLNGSYHAIGVGRQAHTSPLRFGGQHLWMDATGRLRASGSVPASDTAGTVVGMQS